MKLFPFSLLLCVLIIRPCISKADYISLIKADQCESIIEYYLENDGLRVTLEIGPKDFNSFREIVPVELGGELSSEFRSQKVKEFGLNNFVIKFDDKIVLAQILKMEIRNRILRSSIYTGKVDTTINLSSKIWFVELYYPIYVRPRKIEISAPVQKDEQVRLSNIGTVFYHSGIPVNDLRYFTSKLIIDIDWTDPWYTKFRNRNYLRHHSSSLMSYLYIDPYEVRHEVIIRVKDLEEWIHMKYKIDEVIPIKEMDSLKNQIANFIASRNIIKIDGRIEKPIVDKVYFLKVSLSGIQILVDDVELPYNAAIIGVILVYPNEGMPQNAIIRWDMFSDRIRKIPTLACDPAGPMPGYITPEYPDLEWENFLNNYALPDVVNIRVEPFTTSIFNLFIAVIVFLFFSVLFFKRKYYLYALSSGILIIALLFILDTRIQYPVEIGFIQKTSYTVEESEDLLQQMLKNIYRSFDFRDESEIYDKLAISVDGDLLTEMYIQIKKSMILEDQGGIEVKVDKINIIELIPLESNNDELAYFCKWEIKGMVGHWGHKHRRNNLYHANLSLKAIDNSWKLVGLDILQEERTL